VFSRIASTKFDESIEHTGFRHFILNTGFLPDSSKFAVKYRPGRWNTGHMATLAEATIQKQHVNESHLPRHYFR